MGTNGVNKTIEMRFLFLILFFQNYVFSQDSLFWFDMSKVRDPVPKTPMILDKVFSTSQLGMLDSIKNMRIKTSDGYRLQLFESSQSDEAKKIMNKFDKRLPDSLYLVFDAPLYKIQYGNFITKDQAETARVGLKKKGYKRMWIVKSRIDQQSIVNVKKVR